MLAKNVFVASLGFAALTCTMLLGGCVGCGDGNAYPGYCDTSGWNLL